MRTRSQSWSLSDSSRGSCAGDHGHPTRSEEITTRARSRQRLRSDSLRSFAESETQVSSIFVQSLSSCAQSDRLKRRARRRPADPSASCSDASIFDGLDLTQGVTEWRDWANLEAGLVEDIAGRLLALDVAEYLRLRATCKPWRVLTDDPRAGGGLDSRFRPIHWITMSNCASPSHRTLLNIATGVRVDVYFPELSNHHQFGLAEGLLVLCDKTNNTIRLLNPLTGVLTGFPTITDVRALTVPAAAHVSVFRVSLNLRLDSTKVHVPNPSVIKGAGIDDSTSPPTLVLCLRNQLSHIVCAKPGDQHWVSVHHGEQDVDSITCLGQILFYSLLSFGGRCYITTPPGDIMTLDLSPGTGSPPWKPRMVYLLREMALGGKVKASSYLVRSRDWMLMVRYSYSYHGDLASGDSPTTKTFISRGAPSCMDVFEVDLALRRLIPLSDIGDNAVFLGETHTVMLSANKFPKIIPNAVYMSYIVQLFRRFGAFLFKDGTITPPRDLRQYGNRRDKRFLPCACHLELDDYLICDVQHSDNFHNILFIDH